MAKFSQQFLANLGRPQMAERLFGLGAGYWWCSGADEGTSESSKSLTS
jgi:hypothetical protein